MYMNNEKKVRASIEATGNRSSDFDAANPKANLVGTPDDYDAIHRASYTPKRKGR